MLLINEIFRDSVWINWALILLKNVCIDLDVGLNNTLKYRFVVYCGGGYRDGGGKGTVLLS